MRLSMTDVDAAMLQRELEIRRLMRTTYRGAASAAGLPAEERRVTGMWRSLFARFGRRQVTAEAQRLNPSPQPAA